MNRWTLGQIPIREMAEMPVKAHYECKVDRAELQKHCRSSELEFLRFTLVSNMGQVFVSESNSSTDH